MILILGANSRMQDWSSHVFDMPTFVDRITIAALSTLMEDSKEELSALVLMSRKKRAEHYMVYRPSTLFFWVCTFFFWLAVRKYIINIQSRSYHMIPRKSLAFAFLFFDWCLREVSSFFRFLFTSCASSDTIWETSPERVVCEVFFRLSRVVSCDEVNVDLSNCEESEPAAIFCTLALWSCSSNVFHWSLSMQNHCPTLPFKIASFNPLSSMFKCLTRQACTHGHLRLLKNKYVKLFAINSHSAGSTIVFSDFLFIEAGVTVSCIFCVSSIMFRAMKCHVFSSESYFAERARFKMSFNMALAAALLVCVMLALVDQCNSIATSAFAVMSVSSVTSALFMMPGFRARLLRHGSSDRGCKSNSIRIFSYHGLWVCHHTDMLAFALSALRVLMTRPKSQYTEGSVSSRSMKITVLRTSSLLKCKLSFLKSMYQGLCLAGAWSILCVVASFESPTWSDFVRVHSCFFFHCLLLPSPLVGVHPFLHSQWPSRLVFMSNLLSICSCMQNCKSWCNSCVLLVDPADHRAFQKAISSRVSEVKSSRISTRIVKKTIKWPVVLWSSEPWSRLSRYSN